MTTVNHAKTLHQELEETRAAYHALLAEIPDDAWSAPAPTPPGTSVK
ncbi:MAG: hypothetical protein R3E31_22345 [Chloroflexota bacterium]